MRGVESEVQEGQAAALRKELNQTARAKSSLTDLRVRSLIEDEEYVAKRATLAAQADRLEEELRKRTEQPDYWFEPSRAVISLCVYAISWHRHGSPQDRRLLLNSIGSNLSLQGRKLSICAKKPFVRVPKARDSLYLCTFVDAIREMSSDPEFKAAVAAIQELERRFGTQLTVLAEKPASKRSSAARPSLVRRQSKSPPRNLPDTPLEMRSGLGR